MLDSLLAAVQIASLATILIVSWLLFDRLVFVLIAASLVLALSLYIDHGSSVGT